MKLWAFGIAVALSGMAYGDSLLCSIDDYEFKIANQTPAPGDQELGSFIFSKIAEDKTREVFMQFTSDPVSITGKKRPLNLLTGQLSGFHVDIDDAVHAKVSGKVIKVATDRKIFGEKIEDIQAMDFALDKEFVAPEDGKTYSGSLRTTTFQPTGTGGYFSSRQNVDCKYDIAD